MNSREIGKMDQALLSAAMKLRFYPIVLQEGKGAVLVDADGREYLDFNAGWAVANTGYGHPRISKVISRQLEKLSFSSLTSAQSQESVWLAEELIGLTPGSFEKKVWFGHSGSDANELIAKLSPVLGRPVILTFTGSYHGQTMGACSMSGHPALNRYAAANHVIKLPYPYCYRCPFEKEQESCGLFCLRYIEDYVLKFMCSPAQVGALVAEAIQSDGGDVVPPDGFLKGLEQICRKHDILLVLDEVKSGLGRTGKWFAFQHWDVTPDVVILGKPLASGQPLSAVVGRRELLDAGSGAHLFTTAGNPVACKAALETLDIIREEKLSEQAQLTGAYLLHRLEELKKRFEVIGQVRGKGLLLGVELVKDSVTREPAPEIAAMVAYRCFELGLLFYCVGIHSNVLEFTPPLILTTQQAEKGVRILARALEEVMAGRLSPEKVSGFSGWNTYG